MTDVVLAEVGESIDADGIRTNVLRAGEGAPVVLVHGSGPGVTAYANWRLTVPDLAARFRVIAPDMAGFGRSDKPGGYGMKLWTGQLLALLDALDLEKVHGRDDQVIPLANSARLHTLIERSELHVFGRCGHWTQIDWAAEFNQLLVRFLGRPDRQG